jgi:hypothetical protein
MSKGYKKAGPGAARPIPLGHDFISLGDNLGGSYRFPNGRFLHFDLIYEQKAKLTGSHRFPP